MNIFLLEDELIQRESFVQFIREVLAENQWLPKSITATSKPSELLEVIPKKAGFNTYFLDIEINGQERKGLEIATEIRKLDQFATIVFVSTHSEFAPITYQYRVSAFDFIDKGAEPNEIKAHIQTCLAENFTETNKLEHEKVLHFQNRHANFMVHLSDLLYFETMSISHKIQLVKENLQVIQFYGKLSEIEEMNDILYRCHQSYLINLKKVAEIDRANNLVVFKNGKTCLIARRKIKDLQKKLSELHSSK